ncbi:alpha/beta hydrolase family protein [Microbulbifer sp. JMSA002]|uniref:alpha/beta hydrolase family protein n=1 Tax=Microbulbifer sp. JMSA002 TaxID=3243368 RepID=UPI0040395BBC
MKTLLKLFFIIFLAGAAKANSIDEHRVKRADDTNISYYQIQQSPSKPSETLLLILQGSDCNSVLKIESIFTDYKNIWPEADLLLIEKYGIDSKLSYSLEDERTDCPDQYIQNDNPEQRVSDIQDVLDAVRKNYKYQNYIILGGSEGAVIANLATARIDYIDATISFNGGGRKFIDDLIHSITLNHPVSEDPEMSIKEVKNFAAQILNSEEFDFEASQHSYNWWHQSLAIDQQEVLMSVDIPLLIIQGGRDLSVSPQMVDKMMLTLEDLGKDNIEYRKYKELDHGLKDINGRNMRKEVVKDINLWLKSKLKTSNKSQIPAN